jgi:hypothetical protein
MFIGLTLLSLIVQALISRTITPILRTRIVHYYSGQIIVSFLSVIQFMLLSHGAMSYAVFQIFLEGRASVGEPLRRLFLRFPVLLLAMFVAVFIPGTIIILPIAAIFETALSRLSDTLWFLIAVIGLIAANITPYVLFCMWYILVPVCIVEWGGPLQNIGRSRCLTKGRRMRICGLLIFMIFVLAITGIISKEVGFIVQRTIDAKWAGILISAVADIVPRTFFNIMPTVVYCSLRVEKEDLTVTSLADTFD